jgi:hypothetical protein
MLDLQILDLQMLSFQVLDFQMPSFQMQGRRILGPKMLGLRILKIDDVRLGINIDLRPSKVPLHRLASEVRLSNPLRF